MNFLSLGPNHPLKAAVLNLYSAIALCNNGAKKLLEGGNPASLRLMVNCMDSSNPDYLKVAGFKLAECFVACEAGRTKMIELYRAPLVKSIVDGLSLRSKNPAKDQMPLIKGACCVSKIICWPGIHNVYFWEHGIESVLLKLLLPNSRIPRHSLSSDDLITYARNGLKANFLCELKNHVWDILGGLAAHCGEDFSPDMLTSELHLQTLITCACIDFIESMYSVCQIDYGNYANVPVSRAVLLMLYSPSKYIVSLVKSVLPKMLEINAEPYIIDLLAVDEIMSQSYSIQAIKLISLACYAGVKGHHVNCFNGIMTLLSYIDLLYDSLNDVKPLRMSKYKSPHFCEHGKNMCCYDSEEKWIGDETCMVLGLLGLAELIRCHFSSKKSFARISDQLKEFGVANIITLMQDICINCTDSGARWYAAYILSHFGIYGFPSKFGNRIGNNPEDVNVNHLIVTIRCKQVQTDPENVNKEALQKLLEYVYKGYLKTDNQDLVESLEELANRYNLQALARVLGRRRPIWRTPFPVFDLTSAREPGPDGLDLSDIILVANGITFYGWKCKTCSISQPHLHAHKDILCLSCEYIRGMLRSGSCIEIDIGWEALVKLVNWFYSGDLVPKPKHDCLWRRLNEKENIEQIISYVELYCLSNFWLLKDLQEECETVISTCLDSVDKVRKMVADHSHTNLADLVIAVLDENMADILTSLRKP